MAKTKTELIDIQVTIKPWLAQLSKITEKADEIFITPKGEEILISLLNAQKEIEGMIENAKQKLEVAALKANPNFSSIQADKIKVYYRAYGARFYIDEAQINLTPKELYTAEQKLTYKIDTKAVEKWVDQHGGMPAGIREVERAKSITFSLKDKNGGKNEE